MRKPGKLAVAGLGLLGLVGCESLQEAGPTIASYVMGANAASNQNLTPERRAALAHAADFMAQERRNEAMEKSRPTINFYNGQQERNGAYIQQDNSQKTEAFCYDY